MGIGCSVSPGRDGQRIPSISDFFGVEETHYLQVQIISLMISSFPKHLNLVLTLLNVKLRPIFSATNSSFHSAFPLGALPFLPCSLTPSLWRPTLRLASLSPSLLFQPGFPTCALRTISSWCLGCVCSFPQRLFMPPFSSPVSRLFSRITMFFFCVLLSAVHVPLSGPLTVCQLHWSAFFSILHIRKCVITPRWLFSFFLCTFPIFQAWMPIPCSWGQPFSTVGSSPESGSFVPPPHIHTYPVPRVLLSKGKDHGCWGFLFRASENSVYSAPCSHFSRPCFLNGNWGG